MKIMVINEKDPVQKALGLLAVTRAIVWTAVAFVTLDIVADVRKAIKTDGPTVTVKKVEE